MSVRGAIGTTVGTTTSALGYLRWWLDWHARAYPTDGCRSIEH